MTTYAAIQNQTDWSCMEELEYNEKAKSRDNNKLHFKMLNKHLPHIHY